MTKGLHITFSVIVAIIFKLSFFYVAFFVNDTVLDKISTQPVFKVGKNRRRTSEVFSKNQVLGVVEEMAATEKEESERKIKGSGFSLPSMLTLFLHPYKATVLNISEAPNFRYLFPYLFKTHLSISVLRI